MVSRPLSTVAPVVVRPEIVSKTASVNDRCWLENRNGSEPKTLIDSQLETVST